MRKVLTLFIALILSTVCANGAAGQGEGKRRLLPVVLKGKWGFIDRTGKVVVAPQFDALGNWGFSEALIEFRVGSKWGYLDESGAIRIAPRFDEVRPFSEGMAAVRLGDKWGFIDRGGTMLIAPRFKDVVWGHAGGETFSEGMAAVRLGDRWGFVNKAGEVVIEPQFDEVRVFLHGIARVTVKGKSGQPDKVGYIDRSGKYVSQPNEDDYHGFQPLHAGNFSEGMSFIRDGARWGFVNSEGEIVAKGFEAEKLFSEGLAAVRMGGKWGFIDKSGKIAIEPRFEDADPFSEGLAFVTESDGTLGYIDQAGRLSIKIGRKNDAHAERFFASGFKDGLATINLGDDAGYIDRAGTYVIRLKKGDRGAPFSGDLAQVHRGESTSYVDKTGAYLFEPKLLFDLGEWSEGLIAARAESNGRYGYMNRSGRFVVAPQFDEADEFADGLAHVRIANKHGFIDRSGRFIIPLKFDDVSPFFDGIAKVGLEDYRPLSPERQKIGYIDNKGNYIWKPTD
jgi:hypothetical protein